MKTQRSSDIFQLSTFRECFLKVVLPGVVNDCLYFEVINLVDVISRRPTSSKECSKTERTLFKEKDVWMPLMA